ncbi:MAG: exodeoxyribonuclease III [Ruminococcaceae bacterium]|nr:exodeoxyribonuclease III [Oscillospiraceae bacterium]
MKFVSWNVNGLRACMGKGFMDSFAALDADFFCLQETKLQAGQIEMELPGYHQYWCYAQKKGYSGTAIFTRHEPRSASYGLGIDELDTEGRVITLEYDEFYIVTCYTPNAQRGLARIEHRLKWEDAFRQYLVGLDAKKPVILCGDLNVAHNEIDLKNPSSNRGNAGFSDQERAAFSALLDAGFTDSFRHLYPDKTGAYSWWSYMFNARQNNAGWRIDYFVVSDRLADAIHDATIHPDILGSDHCPVGLDLNITCNGGIRIAPPDIQESQDRKEADGSDSVGLGRIFLKLGICALVIAVAIIATLRFFPKSEPSPCPVMVTIPRMESHPSPVPLISQIIDRSGNCSHTVQPVDVFSSTLPPEYFVCGEERFRVEPVFATDLKMLHSANFHLQVVFSKSYPSTDKPDIVWKNNTSYHPGTSEHYLHTRYYYGEDGNIAGCFLYGYLSHTVDLEVTARYDGVSCTEPVHVTPFFDFDSMTTEELVNLIDDSYILLRLSLSSYSGTLDLLIDTEPTLQELLKREDAIRVLLDVYSTESSLSASTLLHHPRFQALMTDEEKLELEKLLNIKYGDDVLYGEIIEDTNSNYKIIRYTVPPRLFYTTPDNASSSMVQHLQIANNTWMLDSPVTDNTNDYNFCIRIRFPEECQYTDPNRPELTIIELPYEGISSNTHRIHTRFYYEGETIAGCFIFGHLSWYTVINTIISHNDYIGFSQRLYVGPYDLEVDIKQLSTETLISYLMNSDELLHAWALNTPEEIIDAYLESSPCAQELLTRSDAIDVMIDLSRPKEYGLQTLFYSSMFYPLATESQIAAFESGQSNWPV